MHANIWLYGRMFHNSRIFLQNINISDRKQPNTVDSLPSFETGISVHGDAEQEVVSHPFPPVFSPRLCCVCAAPQSESASPYKLYSRRPCIALNLCFWFRPGISQSLGFEPVSDVPLDRAARVLSACQELEKVARNKLYLLQSVTACLGNYLPSVAFSVARE